MSQGGVQFVLKELVPELRLGTHPLETLFRAYRATYSHAESKARSIWMMNPAGISCAKRSFEEGIPKQSLGTRGW